MPASIPPIDYALPEGVDRKRLAAIAQANLADAQVWRWFSDGMEDGRIRVMRQKANWIIVLDSQITASNESLDAAVREVFQRAGAHPPRTTSWSRFSGSFMVPPHAAK